jgi:hypothetical protein
MYIQTYIHKAQSIYQLGNSLDDAQCSIPGEGKGLSPTPQRPDGKRAGADWLLPSIFVSRARIIKLHLHSPPPTFMARHLMSSDQGQFYLSVRNMTGCKAIRQSSKFAAAALNEEQSPFLLQQIQPLPCYLVSPRTKKKGKKSFTSPKQETMMLKGGQWRRGGSLTKLSFVSGWFLC